MIYDHPNRMFQPFKSEGWIHSTLEPVAGIRINLQRTASIGNLHWVPIGRFDEHIDRIVGASRVSPAHNTGDALCAAVIADDHLTFRKLIGFLVQRRDFFAALGAVHP